MAVFGTVMASRVPTDMSGADAEESRSSQMDDVGDKAGGSEKRVMDTHARILRAAEKLFAEGGFDGTTLRQIALEAATPVASINHHFGSKAGLYRAIFERHSQTVAE